jgi:hypothetical protein
VHRRLTARARALQVVTNGSSVFPAPLQWRVAFLRVLGLGCNAAVISSPVPIDVLAEPAVGPLQEPIALLTPSGLISPASEFTIVLGCAGAAGSSSKTGVIVGAVLGVVVLLALMVYVMCRSSRVRRRSSAVEDDTEAASLSEPIIDEGSDAL